MEIANKPVYINIARPGVYAVLHAKQGDVNRAFTAVFNNDGEAWPIPENAVISIWYRGAAGEGNYTKGVEISGNTATIPFVPQMLSTPGNGLLCIIINTAVGDQVGSWNIPYFVEEVPGGNSEAATEFYTAFSEIASEVAAYALEAKESARAAAASANEVSGTVNNKVSKSGDKMTGPLAVEDYLEVAGEAQLRLRLKDDNIFSISAGANDNIIRVTLRDKNNAFKTSYFLLNPDGTVSLAKDPAEATHAATKAYVDTSTVSINPQALTEEQQATARGNIGAASEKAVTAAQTAADGKLPLSGGDMTGWVNFGQETRGVTWETADGTVFSLRPYMAGNVLQVTRKTPDGEWGTLNIYANGRVEVEGMNDGSERVHNIMVVPAGTDIGSLSLSAGTIVMVRK